MNINRPPAAEKADVKRPPRTPADEPAVDEVPSLAAILAYEEAEEAPLPPAAPAAEKARAGG